ncbi:helix-turn-helix domain-containing protein [Paenibacillus tarimensis]
MEIYEETVSYDNPLLCMRIFKSEREVDITIHWHYHREAEMLLVIDGMLEVHVEDERYLLESGGVAIIGPSQLHRDRSIGHPLRYIVLQLDLEQFFDHSTMPYLQYFFESKNPLSHANYIFSEYPLIRSEVADLIREIFEETEHKLPGYELAVNIRFKQIILLLLRNDPRKVFSQRENFDTMRLKPVFDYVESNLTARIQVEEVCKFANMSYYYFVKFFKKTVGLSFTEYVNYRKIKWAERILLTKDLSITEVGERIGMPNMAHFYKMFKKYNDCSPKEFQKRMLSWKES